MNRVKDYYETAVKFLSLEPMSQYLIGTSFLVMQWEEFILHKEAVPTIIFKRVIENNRYTEFRSLVFNYKTIKVQNGQIKMGPGSSQ